MCTSIPQEPVGQENEDFADLDEFEDEVEIVPTSRGGGNNPKDPVPIGGAAVLSAGTTVQVVHCPSPAKVAVFEEFKARLERMYPGITVTGTPTMPSSNQMIASTVRTELNQHTSTVQLCIPSLNSGLSTSAVKCCSGGHLALANARLCAYTLSTSEFVDLFLSFESLIHVTTLPSSQALMVLRYSAMTYCWTGRRIHDAIGVAVPSWFGVIESSPLTPIMAIYYVSTMAQDRLLASGAFDVTVDGKSVWSTADKGRQPSWQELIWQLEEAGLPRVDGADAETNWPSGWRDAKPTDPSVQGEL